MRNNSNVRGTEGADGPDAVTVLDQLAPNTWVGNGFNLIAVPCREGTAGCELGFNVLVHATLEVLEFSKVTPALDRGAAEPDVTLNTARYLQTVIDCKDGRTVLHNEPGLWVHVPPTNQDSLDTFVRLAVTPHGDSILAQGRLLAAISGPPTIRRISPFPFSGKQGISDIPLIDGDPAKDLTLPENYVRRYLQTPLPPQLIQAKMSGADMINDLAALLRAAVENQTIAKTYPIEISTKLDPPFGVERVLKGHPSVSNLDDVQTAGIRNIPFVNSQADAVLMDAIFWVETMADTSQKDPHYQLQYLQRVILDFQGIHWPHISGATLKNVA